MSAGTPISGATVTVYAIEDDTANVDKRAGNGGVIGVGGPTDESGNATVTLAIPQYSGPLQIVAGGASLAYLDPTAAAAPAGSAPTSLQTVQIPADFTFESYYATYATGTALTLAVDLFTTIADAAVRSYQKGLHSQHPGKKTLSAAMAGRDPLFVRHVVNSPAAWSPVAFRTTVPASLNGGTQAATDGVLAAVFDVALSELAREVGRRSQFPAFNAIDVTRLLIRDVEADGVFDGRGAGGTQLLIGDTGNVLDGECLRFPLAQALDNWVRSTSGKASGISQRDLIASGVFVSMSGDDSDLFGNAPKDVYHLYTVAGKVIGSGGSAVEMSLMSGGSITDTTQTDSSGQYSFPHAVLAGNYTIVPYLSGYTFDPPSAAIAVSSADLVGQTFMANPDPVPTYRISGTIAGAVVSGVRVSLSGPTTMSTATDATGHYAFNGLQNGATFTVTPSLLGYAFTPASVSLNISGADGKQDFTAVMSQISEFALPNKPGPDDIGSPQGIAAGPDGNVWFTDPFNRLIGRITPSGQITEFPIPSGGMANQITAGPDGNLWFTECGSLSGAAKQIGRISPSGQVTEFSIPSGSCPGGIAAGPDGNLWFTDHLANTIGRITPSGAVSAFAIPTASSVPWRIAAGPDGNMWFTEYQAGKLGRITPNGSDASIAGSIVEFMIPDPVLPPAPWGIASGPDGNVWFTLSVNRSVVGYISPTTRSIMKFEIPTFLANPMDIAAGPDGNLWFTEFEGNKIGRITPSGDFAEFAVPTARSGPAGIVGGPDGHVWFTERAGQIGRL